MATETLNTILAGGKKPATQAPPAAPQAPDARESIRQATAQATESKPVPTQPQRISYEEMFKRLNPYQPPTAQELEKERKKQKREQIFAAIGDGISALSNLYFTTQYAPSMYSVRDTASEQTRKRWDKIAADRNANMTAYINGLMRARQMDNKYNDNERAWARQLGIDRAKAELAEEEERRKRALHPFAVREAEGKARKAEAEAENAGEYEKSRIRRNEAAAGASNASASASRSRARYYDRGGSGGGSKYYGEFRGKHYKTEADYEKAVLNAAKDSGVSIYEEEVLERDYKGNPRKTRRVKRSIADIAAEVDGLNRKKPNPMGDDGNEKKPNPMN